MNELALFAGAGGGILGGKLLGWNTIGAVEIEEYPRSVLLQRQRDGILEKFPIWDDIKTFDGKPWNGYVNIVSGGFPCQDISSAGRGKGIGGERSGLWGEMARVVREVSPRFVFVENSPMLTSRGLYRVLGDLAEMGYNARWCVLGADDVGAKHQRKRIWILGYTSMYGHTSTKKRESFNERGYGGPSGEIEAGKPKGSSSTGINKEMANSYDPGLQGPDVRETKYSATERLSSECGEIMANSEIINKRGLSKRTEKKNSGLTQCGTYKYWETDPAEIPITTGKRFQNRSKQEGETSRETNEFKRCCSNKKLRPIKPGLGGMADGLANRMDGFETYGLKHIPRVAKNVTKRVGRIKAIGNGQVSLTAAVAFSILSEGLI